ncbi:MAG: hypothetical protein PWP38_2812 [Clostridiales bacterium]|jgi:AraC-like DNA-binding protein|nr:hypothetical protein [Clostridiales bacterium]
MDNWSKGYVEIESATGLHRVYNYQLPEVIVSSAPIELQAITFTEQGKGQRIAYSYKPTDSFYFTPGKMDEPLRHKLHKHDYFELMIAASGKLEMQIESQLCELENWDVCILNRSTRHAEHFVPASKIIYIVLSAAYLSDWPLEQGLNLPHTFLFSKLFNKGLRDNVQQNKDYILARRTNDASIPALYELVEGIRREFESKQPGYQHFIRGQIYRLLCLIADAEHYTTQYIDLGTDDGFSLAHSAKQLLDQAFGKITKVEIGNRLNYNGEYINKVFKHHYGKTIPEYSRSLRLSRSVDMLCSTDMPISEICRQLGFRNKTNFYKHFEVEYGCTPAIYRKKSH